MRGATTLCSANDARTRLAVTRNSADVDPGLFVAGDGGENRSRGVVHPGHRLFETCAVRFRVRVIALRAAKTVCKVISLKRKEH
jgi:hypothetical protein